MRNLFSTLIFIQISWLIALITCQGCLEIGINVLWLLASDQVQAVAQLAGKHLGELLNSKNIKFADMYY